MRPHTRTQCQDGQDGNQCPECRSEATTSSLAAAGAGSTSSVLNLSGAHQTSAANSTASLEAKSASDPFVAPTGPPVSRRAVGQHAGKPGQPSNSSDVARAMLLVELPAEILFKILNYMSFKEISHLRMVSRRFNEICASMLNSTFQRLQSQMLSRFQEIKTQMPRRESARRNHPLAQEYDVVETLHMRLSLLQMTFGKHIERKHVCFFAGEILDESKRILRYIRQTPNNQRSKKGGAYIFMEDELFDLTTMAMEYFKEHIEPTLPEITYFGADFLDFTSFATPTKRRSVSGSTSVLGGGNCMDSPCSSRASVAGSSVSEAAWSTTSTAATGEVMDMDTVNPQPPQSNMVLRKRIRRIRQGMKRYNDQLVEVKKELKTCKTKMETQSKQVLEYSTRLEEYDKKFEESSRKFQTLLTELNKCKTELQYWRSKSTTLLALPSTCASCAAPLLPTQSAEQAEAELKALANQGIFLTDDLTENLNNDVQKIETSATSASTAEEQASTSMSPPSPVTRGTSCKSGPPSPLSAVGRKRRSRDVDSALAAANADSEVLIPEADSKRKSSLRGNGSAAAASGSGPAAKNTRFKRPKLASAN